ncbi:MAG: methyltransferase domain-containing protein [Proteobacteria bacterium]|nr:methyltransferase domain-containing protein [Desulfobulbaceae bacterium]MBU4151362.1 methyltransferase domain-containing protein [Pseudomonadota bacterium]
MTLSPEGLKNKIAAGFTASAPHYDHHAALQQRAAHSLLNRLNEIKTQIPDGPVLEIGCGTGAVSKKLATLLADRHLTLIDLAPGMIAANRATMAPLIASNPLRVEWQICDAETIDTRHHYALIISCLTLQWFHDLPGSLHRLCSALLPGGILLCSYLGEQSFPEWRQAANTLGLHCTANPLPNTQQIQTSLRLLGQQNSLREEMLQISYPTVHDFFRSLKNTGTNTPTNSYSLTRGQMARLINGWQEQSRHSVTVTYQINTLMVQT